MVYLIDDLDSFGQKNEVKDKITFEKVYYVKN